MNSIGQHICYLLRHHDCVVLPGWGAFMAHRCPASIDTVSGTVRPPQRVLGFNSSITHDDGLIASSIARREKLSYDKAMQRVADAVGAMRRQIVSDRELYMSGLGSFCMTDEDAIVFEPLVENVVSLPLAAFPEVHMIPVLDAVKDDDAVAEYRDTLYLPLSRNWLKIAASLIVLVCMGFLLSTPISIPEAARASLAAPAITFASDDDDESFELSDANRHGVLSIVIPQADDAVDVVDTAELVPDDTEVSTSAVVSMDDADAYCVIVASLASRDLAQEFIDRASIPMSILEKDGKYRVYAATGATPEQALASARQAGLTDCYPEAWVCRR